MATIPQPELRNYVGEVLRRAEAAESITVAVSGRPVAKRGRRRPTPRRAGQRPPAPAQNVLR